MNVRFDARGQAHVSATDEFMTADELEEAILQLARVYFQLTGALPQAPSFKAIGIDKEEVVRLRAKARDRTFASAVEKAKGR